MDEQYQNAKTVLVGDTYETPEDAAQYAEQESEALRMLGGTGEDGTGDAEQEDFERDRLEELKEAERRYGR